MNIWALKKDTSVKHLLLLLTQQFPPDTFDIIDNPSDDKRSIRLANTPATSAQLYVYTYGQQEECYGVHIEYPDLKETSYSDTIEIHENISFDQLIHIISSQLEVPVTGTAENI